MPSFLELKTPTIAGEIDICKGKTDFIYSSIIANQVVKLI